MAAKQEWPKGTYCREETLPYRDPRGTRVIEQFCQANGQILLPIVNLSQNASQVVEHVIYVRTNWRAIPWERRGRRVIMFPCHGALPSS